MKNRRDFLKTTGTAALGMTVASACAQTQNQTTATGGLGEPARRESLTTHSRRPTTGFLSSGITPM